MLATRSGGLPAVALGELSLDPAHHWLQVVLAHRVLGPPAPVPEGEDEEVGRLSAGTFAGVCRVHGFDGHTTGGHQEMVCPISSFVTQGYPDSYLPF